ncbi:protein dopey-2 isoform X2 [Rhinatrema bivittatum]|nr:protein dopey-2 isoform X2 [Rhinatrema bivittatum]XP_029459353.1 protein dopey-2 isoform X2 [Rhinatrema bivittatum]
MLGADHRLAVKSLCISVTDSNVLVQRNTLEVLLFFFPFYTCLDSNDCSIPLLKSDMVHILSAASQTLLRRDMSLNRRLYAWLLGSDIKGGVLAPETNITASSEDPSASFFEKYSRELLVQALVEILHQKILDPNSEQGQHVYLKPFRILISLLDKLEIGPQVVGDLFLEVIRAFYAYCKDVLGSDLTLSYGPNSNTLTSAIKENKNASEIVKTVNLLITSLSVDFLWDYMTRCFEDCFRKYTETKPATVTHASTPPTVSELCTLLVFLLDVIPLELYSEVQTQYLPQMLSCMVQSLLENVEALSLPELSHALKTCFKVLSKVQMPPAYLDMETGSGTGSPTKGKAEDAVSEVVLREQEDDSIFPPLKSEDSGIGLSASSPELSQHLGMPRVIPGRDNVWTSAGCMQKTQHCIQELIANFAGKHIFRIQLHAQGEGNSLPGNLDRSKRPESGHSFAADSSSKKKRSSWEARQVIVPQFKQMLSDLFTGGPQLKQKSLDPVGLSACDEAGKQKKGEEDWDIDRAVLDMGQTTEDCREAFTAACHLLLDCTTFPVYLSEEETEQLYLSLFQMPGGGDAGFPLWFKSLMICCCVSDCYIQNVSISTLLEVINHSQSLALVIDDRIKRYKTSDYNPFFGKLQMVTIPPISPGVLKLLADRTDFYQRVAHVLWNQLNKETREHHITCVELFYRLHCLAPSANICEEIICQALLENDKGTRLEALFRFSIIWHLTREIQGSRVTSHNRSFDRSLFVVLDSLNCTDGAIGAAAQGWLVRALSLNDVARILEPVLLLLLHPKTQRTSIHCIKQKNSTGSLNHWFRRKRTYLKESVGANELQESSSENLPVNQITTVDREAIWAEVEKDPEKLQLNVEWVTDRGISHLTEPAHYTEDSEDNSDHTESADTSTGHGDSENTSSFSPPSFDLQERSNEENCGRTASDQGNLKHACLSLHNVARPSALLNLARTDSEKTQASESLSSDEEADLELKAIQTSRLLKQQKEKQEMIEALFKHILLYLQPYDSKRVLYAFSVLEAVLKTNPKEFIEAVAEASMDTSSTAHLNLIYNLLARHQEALVGQSFYGKLQMQSPTMCPHSLLIELLIYLCLSFLRSYYSCYLKISHRDVLGNRDVQVKSVEVLIRIMSQLTVMAKPAEGKNVEFIHSLLERCKVQEFVLLSLSASMHISQKKYELVVGEKASNDAEESLFEESLINFGQDQIWSEHPLQIELLKLLQVLIVLEHHLRQVHEEQENQIALSKEWQQTLNFQKSINAMQYVQSHPITSQGLFVSAIIRALRPEYGYGMHPPWVALVTSSLPYFRKSLGWAVAPFIAQICKNLDELVKQYENESVKMEASMTSKRENIPPDYPLTLLEGLTTISHFCLLDHPTPAKKSLLADPTNMRNARSAILEELPRIVNTMSLLWRVIRKEDLQKRSGDLLRTMKGSSSVYFKATKTLRQKILDFLNPLTAPLGVQLIAAVASVWNKKKARSQNKTKILPAASEAQLTLLDLVCSLNTLKTDTILQLVKEVVKKPPQIKSEEKASLVDIPMLQFSSVFIQRLSASSLQENLPSLLGLLRESVSLNLAPPGYFLLLSILNDFVTRTPNLENKKDQRDLQEVTQKILEAVGNVAGSSLEQTSWLSRNLEVKVQPQINFDETDSTDDFYDGSVAPSSMVSASAPSVYSVQALSLLAEVLASLLDMVYRSDEKEKAVPLITRLLYYVFPYLRNHSAYNSPSFRAGSQLLSSLSGYAYTKRAWKKEVLELYMDPAFFRMDMSCVHWKSVIDHLLTHEKTMFKDLMNMQSSSLKLFPSSEQKAMLLKRQAFSIFSGELDQYHLYLPLIQERLTENLRVGQTSVMAAQMFLFFRVLLLRISPQHLTSLWPIMVTELIQAFVQLAEDLTEEDDSPKGSSRGHKQKAPVTNGIGPLSTDIQQDGLDLYLSACKFLDTALSFPPDKMPLFQMYRWAFVPEVEIELCSLPTDIVEHHQQCKPHVVRILELLQQRDGLSSTASEINSQKRDFPLLNLRSVSSITQLMPFFRILSSAFKTGASSHSSPQDTAPPSVEYPVQDNTKVLKELEENVEYDFLDSLEA